MTEINLIKKDTDLSNLPKPYDWDVVIHKRPYYVVRIEGFVHTIGGRWGNNDLWAYPRDEKPSYENLIEFEADTPVCWGIIYQPTLYTKCKWDECFARNGQILQITRNGEVFYDQIFGGITKAFDLLNRIDEHPLKLSTIDFDKKAVGRKVWWRSEPAIIASYIHKQACVILKPDGIAQFTVPAEFAKEDPEYYEDRNVKTTIFDEHIWWYRD